MLMRFILLLLPLLLAADVDEDRIKRLEARIAQLEGEHNDTFSTLEDIQSVVDGVERKSYMDVVDFTPEVRLRFDRMDYEVGVFEPIATPSSDGTIPRNRDDFDKDFSIASSVRFRLNMRANVLDNASFYGRLVFQHSTQSNSCAAAAG
jgi:hypothetical protein